jgi:hypothetical protein
MNTHQGRQTDLPLRGDLRPIYVLSVIIAILMAAAAIAGLFYQSATYPSEDLLETFLPTDVSILFIALPMLLGSMWFTWREKWIGLLLWPGALIFVLYTYLTYVFAMPLNAAFLLHLTLILLCVYTLIGLLASIEPERVRGRLASAVPERLSGGILAGLGLLFFLRASGVLVGALVSQTPLAETELALNSSDFLFAPTWVFSGVLLWRREALGYVTSLGLLFQASMLFIGLILIMLVQPFISDSSVSLVDVAVVFAMSLISFVPFGLFLRGVVGDRSSRTK